MRRVAGQHRYGGRAQSRSYRPEHLLEQPPAARRPGPQVRRGALAGLACVVLLGLPAFAGTVVATGPSRPAPALAAPVMGPLTDLPVAPQTSTPPASPARETPTRVAPTPSRPIATTPQTRPAPSPAAPAAGAVSVAGVTVGHYLRSLTGTSADLDEMRNLGTTDARNTPTGQHALVLLDIGGQSPTGVLLSLTQQAITYESLASALSAYASAYTANLPRRASATIALGTNNDLAVSATDGQAWARFVVNPVRLAAHSTRVAVIGADDIEPGFHASARATRAWVHGYLSSTSAALLFNGSADGCPTDATSTTCGHSWQLSDMVGFAGGIAPTRTLVLPQIYNADMAAQWGQIAAAAVAEGLSAPHIVGALTENAACVGDPTCPTLPAPTAWTLLRDALVAEGVPPAAHPTSVDLDVQ